MQRKKILLIALVLVLFGVGSIFAYSICSTCNGTGSVKGRMIWNGYNWEQQYQTCPSCRGSGYR
jgi:DnaJ-class molecular chaperone